MAEQIKNREYEDILKELFGGGEEAALAKLAKVRRTEYEMNLWRKHNLPLSEIPGKYRMYFRRRFLNSVSIEKATQKELDEAFYRLRCAVGMQVNAGGEHTGCYMRCLRLVGELNSALARNRLKTVEPGAFLDWLTFDFTVPTGLGGEVIEEKGKGFEIRIFHSDDNRKEFWAELQKIMREHRRMSMQGVVKIVLVKRKESIILENEGT